MVFPTHDDETVMNGPPKGCGRSGKKQIPCGDEIKKSNDKGFEQGGGCGLLEDAVETPISKCERSGAPRFGVTDLSQLVL